MAFLQTQTNDNAEGLQFKLMAETEESPQQQILAQNQIRGHAGPDPRSARKSSKAAFKIASSKVWHIIGIVTILLIASIVAAMATQAFNDIKIQATIDQLRLSTQFSLERPPQTHRRILEVGRTSASNMKSSCPGSIKPCGRRQTIL